MDKEHLIEKAYQRFSDFKKPEYCMIHIDACPECRGGDLEDAITEWKSV